MRLSSPRFLARSVIGPGQSAVVFQVQTSIIIVAAAAAPHVALLFPVQVHISLFRGQGCQQATCACVPMISYVTLEELAYESSQLFNLVTPLRSLVTLFISQSHLNICCWTEDNFFCQLGVSRTFARR